MSSIRFSGVARTWLECLPLGDGRLAVMTDGGVTRTVLHLNDAGAWSGSPGSETQDGVPDAAECARLLADARAAIATHDPVGAQAPLQALQTRYAQSFMPLADVQILVDVPGESDVTRELDLATGVHHAAAGALSTMTFIVPAHSVLVHAIPASSSVEVTLASPLRAPDGSAPRTRHDGDDRVLLLRLPSDVAPGHEPDLPAARWDGPALEAAVVARVVRRDDMTIVFVATATTFAGPGAAPSGSAQDAADEATARLDRVCAVDVEVLREEAASHMRELRGGVSLRLGDDRAADATPIPVDTALRLAAARADSRGILAGDPGLVALLFEFGRYLLICSSRPGGLPATLQGLWNADMRPPWGSGYTLNINTEMNYWGAQVTGLDSRMLPLTDFTIALADVAAVQTRRLYGVDGWTVHHNSDAWLYATSPGRGSGDPRWSFWPLGGAWLAVLLTEAWEFGAASADDLTRIWPTVRGAAQFALAWHRDGVTSPATSPENAFLTDDGRAASLAATSTMDLALIRAVLTRTVQTAEALGLADDPIALAAAERVPTIPAQPPLTSEGTIMEWDVERAEEDPHHRHLSALYGLFPGDELWDESRRAAAVETLDRRGDDSSGWSLVWKLALWARLGRGDRVADLLALALRDAQEVSGPWAGGLYPNLFAAHPPFQIDANLGFVGALAEALLQSHDGIRLLPALPDALASGEVTGLIARPGITVDIRWRDGLLETARLRARHERASGVRRVGWAGRWITVDVSAEQDTELDHRSFSTEEVHP